MARLWLHDYDVGPIGCARAGRSAIEPRSVRPVTNLAGSDGLEPSRRYCVPRQVTAAGRRAFHEVMQEWAAQLADQMEIDARRSSQVDPEYTAIQVHDARRAVERQNVLRVEQDCSGRRVIAVILLAIGSLGITVLSDVLVGPLQVLAVVLSPMVLVAGLILTWTGRAGNPRGEP